MSAGDPVDLAALLRDLPLRSMRRRLARCIPHLDFMDGEPPGYLFASRRPNRLNPRGVECVYFSETEIVADIEYRARFRGTPAANQPKLLYFARVRLTGVLDLGDPPSRHACGIGEDDLFGPWRGRASLTRLQRLGLEVSRQTRVVAVRYPSAGAHREGRGGSNVVVFRAAMGPGESLEILGRTGEPLERWP